MSSCWNYRVMYDEAEGLYSIQEVYYKSTEDADDNIVAAFGGATLDNWEEYGDLEETHKLMGKALDKPVIAWSVDDDGKYHYRVKEY